MNSPTPSKIQAAIDLLQQTGNYRVLERLPEIDCYNVLEGTPNRLLVVDVETTGLKAADDKIIEVGAALIEFEAATGRLGKTLARYNGLEDPGFPLSEETTELTGITDADVAGQKIDTEAVEKLGKAAHLVIAHNASLDRAFMEKRFPIFEKCWWACSFQEGPWKDMGFTSQKLDYLCVMAGGFFYKAHRASVDVDALTRLLTLEADGKTVLKRLLEQSRKPSYRIWATDSPFDSKDMLKQAKYNWSPEDSPNKALLKAWNKTVRNKEELDVELAFLADLYPKKKTSQVVVDAHDGFIRYSERLNPEKRQKIALTDYVNAETPTARSNKP